MEEHLAAIGRAVGKVDTDSGGMARYSMKLEVPSGILHDSAPDISLQYCQGAANGILGAGWALGGISSIRRMLSTLAYDGPNVPSAGYDRSKPKLSLDGAELLNISGDYESQEAVYSTELESIACTVTRSGTGFVVHEASGHWAEYGTTTDSCVLVAGTSRAREWRLKKRVDYHGNATTYDYVVAPTKGNINTCYLSSIRYSSNEKAGLQARRFIQFDYTSRSDLVVQCDGGDDCTWASLLTAVNIGTLSGPDHTKLVKRSYELSYDISEYTGDSQLSAITETSISNGKLIKLLPSLFGHTSTGVEPQNTFPGTSPQVVNLEVGSSREQLALFTTNISGRCLADIALIQHNRATGQMFLKTYLASHSADGSIDWVASDGPGAQANLPLMDKKIGFPEILCPDMNNDGRADIVIPYRDENGYTCFSISRCVGTGYESATVKKTGYKWTQGKFIAIDHSGRGSVDIVQIFASSTQGKLAFRVYPGINESGQIGLRDAVTTETAYEYRDTLDWFQLRHAGTGASSLTRTYAQDAGADGSQLKATTFTLTESGEMQELATSLLGDPVTANQTKASVLPCDINADGTQDIVLATAEFEDDQMAFTFSIFLGDGLGGFRKHDEIKRKSEAPPPLKYSNYGKFHITNMSGTSYPTLSYVYQERDTRSHVALSVDGRCDALLGAVRANKLAGHLPSADLKLVPVDINGKGTGDWLFYTLDNNDPRVMPVYNHATVPDYLAWAQNPMGLRTTLTYSPMTDPTAYEPGVNWRRYENSQKDSYPVIAASNYVVTQLEHRNEKSINSLSYALSLKKTYTNARMNTTGRGWQGFEKINTWNVTSGVLNTEKYLQAWPFTGTKTQIDTKSPDEAELLCSYRTSYETHERASGPWKIFQVHRTLEETNMYEKGIVARSNGVRYQYDKHGNMVLRSPFEQQNGKMVTQSYKRCQYTTIDGVTNVLEGEKLSSKESNVDMFRFEEGDLTLTRYDNETSRAVLAGILEWSSDIGSFLRKSIKFNSLGKEIEAVGTAGLKRTTTYDDVFQSFVVKVTQEGPGISTTEFTAYDEASGLEVALKKTDGDLSCLALDAFGRTYETRTSAAAQGPSTVSATDFLKGTNFVAHPSFSALLQTTDLNPQREVSFVRQKSQAGLSYLCSKIVTISHEGTSGRHEIIDFVDCAKQIRKRSSRNSDEPHKTWMAWEFDPRGQQIFESFPVLVPSSVDLNWEPDRRQGVNVTLDILGRPIARIRPAHADQDHLIKISNTYLDGGARIQERTMTSKTVGATTRGDADTVALIERRYLRIEDKDLVSESTDENGLTSKFEYNAFGALVQCTDPSGQVEQHFYNSLGDLVAVDNIYQNTARTSGSSGTTYRYNDKHELEEQTNAAGESIRFQRDSGGRLLQKLGDDGRIARFTYDTGSSEKILSITTYAHGLNQPPESSVHFTWDHRGRLSSRKLVLRENETFITSMVYDWQDRVIEKTLPDFSVVRSEYRGSQLIAHSISGGANSTWSLKAETMKFSGYGRPEEMKIQGSGMSNATHQWKFDSLGFPTSHTLSSDKSILVQESYFYNDLDQMTRKHELISATTVDYEYRGRRLAVSRRDGADASYEYDRVGNIVKNRDVTIEPTAGGLSGRRDNGQVAFNISYDGAGRLTQRTTPASSFAFTYDSFGSLQSMKNSKAALEVTFLSNFEGHTLERKLSDGTGDLFISNDYSIHYNADGSRTIHHKLFDSEESEGSAHLLGTVTTTHEFSSATRPLSKSLSTNFADTKGNVTHTFDADFRILGTVHYDDFGAPSRSTADGSDGVANATYEGKYLEAESGLILFGARWYDPLVGRFTAPDDIIDVKHLALPDGLNRYAFENNDPINHTDPTGHWSLSAIFGVVIAAVLVVAAIAITIATAGAATPLLGAVVGALASAGVAGITYSIKHQDDDAGVFWKGYATTMAIQGTIGFISGGLGAFARPATTAASVFGRMIIKGIIGGITSVVSQLGERGVEAIYYGKHENLVDGLATSFAIGFLAGFAGAGFGNKVGKPDASTTMPLRIFARQILSPTNRSALALLQNEGRVALAKCVGAAGLTGGGGKLAGWGTTELDLVHKGSDFYRIEIVPLLHQSGFD